MDTQQNPAPPLQCGIHSLHLLLLIASAALVFPVVIYLLFILAFLLMPGSMD